MHQPDTPERALAADHGCTRPISSAPGRDEDDAALFRVLYPPLRRFAAIWAPVGIDPDDLVSEAVAKTLARGRLIDLDNPGAYLRTAVANIARNMHRHQHHRGRTHVEASEPTFDHYPSDLVELDRLSPEQRAVLFLVDVERIGYGEAAAILGCSTSAARTRTLRARAKLRRLITRQRERDQ